MRGKSHESSPIVDARQIEFKLSHVMLCRKSTLTIGTGSPSGSAYDVKFSSDNSLTNDEDLYTERAA